MTLAATLDAAGRQDPAAYRPQPVVEAVDALWALGRDGALDAIEAHLARRDLLADPQEGLLLVLRVLFEVPDPPGHQPPLGLGGTALAPPSDPRALPHFPLLLVDDWPLLLVTGFALAGDVPPVTAQLPHWRATGRLRPQPLAPAQPAQAVLARCVERLTRAYGVPPDAALSEGLARQLRIR